MNHPHTGPLLGPVLPDGPARVVLSSARAPTLPCASSSIDLAFSPRNSPYSLTLTPAGFRFVIAGFCYSRVHIT